VQRLNRAIFGEQHSPEVTDTVRRSPGPVAEIVWQCVTGRLVTEGPATECASSVARHSQVMSTGGA